MMDVATFILLADPQLGHDKDTQAQIQKLSKLNEALNSLSSQPYPADLDITCKNQPVGQLAGVFFAGDLTNYGGGLNLSENSNIIKYHPHNYSGGPQLQDLRALYDPWHPRKGVTQLSGCGKLYFGLGNHGMFTAASHGEFVTMLKTQIWSVGTGPLCAPPQ